MDNELKQLLRMLISVIARGSYPEDKLLDAIAPSKNPKYIAAYNYCDGTRIRVDIAKAAGLDKDNLNKAVARWIKLGIVFEFEDDGQAKLLHIYPILFEPPAKAKGKSPKQSADG